MPTILFLEDEILNLGILDLNYIYYEENENINVTDKRSLLDITCALQGWRRFSYINCDENDIP